MTESDTRASRAPSVEAPPDPADGLPTGRPATSPAPAALDDSITDEDDDDDQLCSICLDALPGAGSDIARSTRSTQLLAVVQPCGHQYHDFCIKSWSQRANTCPTCRTRFHAIEVSAAGSTSVLPVQDKVFPMPEEDLADVVADDDYDPYHDPDYLPRSSSSYLVPYSVCILCDEMSSAATGLVVCSSCSGCFHPHCLGDISNADVWHCPMCDTAQSGDSVVAPSTVARLRRAGASRRAVSSFISSLRDEIRTSRRSALGLPFEPISRRQRSIRRRIHDTNNNTVSATGMFPPAPAAAPPAEPPVQRMSPEEANAWKLYDRAKRADATKPSSRQSTPVPATGSSSSSDKKVKKPVRKKHREPAPHLAKAVSDAAAERAAAERTAVHHRPTSFSQLLSTIHSGGTAAARDRPTVGFAGVAEDSGSPGSSSNSHETSPTSAFVSSDDDIAAPDLPGKTAPARLTAEALSKHDSVSGSSGGAGAVRPRRRRTSERAPTELTSAQKALLQKIIVRGKLRPFYSAKKIDSSKYTEINKSVSRQLYKEVEQNELRRDSDFIVLLNKLIELRERYEYESHDTFAKRILSDSHTSEEDRDRLERYSQFVSECINREIGI